MNHSEEKKRRFKNSAELQQKVWRTSDFASLWILVLWLAATVNLKAQDCSDAIYRADKMYANGQISQVIESLEPCVSGSLNADERFEAYRLLALAYLNNQDQEKADEYIRKLLMIKPQYQKYPNNDPLELTRRINQFDVSAKYSVGFDVGFNLNSVKLIKSYSVYSSPQSYVTSPGYQFGGSFNYAFIKNWSVEAGVFYYGLFIKHQIDNAGGQKQIYKETQQFFSPGLNLTYNRKVHGSIELYAGVGFGNAFLTSSNVFFTSENIESKNIRLATRNSFDDRTKSIVYTSEKIGVSIPFNIGRLHLECMWLQYQSNAVIANRRMSDRAFIYSNQYINDDFKNRPMMVNAGISWPVKYQVKKATPKKSDSN